ncbi:MAG: response regulator [Bacteroidales bacterium]|nr:response regulator [Bacteroidales bacterium]MBN2763493.1 response regulator [Bacteroidales bacterium]
MGNLKTLLYVDDEPLNLQLFAFNFRNKFNVRTAESGQAGLDILKNESSVSVVISDMKMPGMNGIEFIQKAKAKFPEIICFILTGYDITDEILLALKDKLIHKYFRKPFDMKEVEKAILEALQ